MKYIQGNLLDGDWDVAMHNCNVHKTMGAGVAYHLKNKWPEVYKADLDYDEEPEDKLGKSSVAILPDNRLVFNLYGQVGIGNNGHPLDRNCRYDHLYNAIYSVCENLCRLESEFTIGVPMLGCGLAGGSWTVVEAILKDIETKFPVEFVVYDLG